MACAPKVTWLLVWKVFRQNIHQHKCLKTKFFIESEIWFSISTPTFPLEGSEMYENSSLTLLRSFVFVHLLYGFMCLPLAYVATVISLLPPLLTMPILASILFLSTELKVATTLYWSYVLSSHKSVSSVYVWQINHFVWSACVMSRLFQLFAFISLAGWFSQQIHWVFFLPNTYE